MGFGKAPQGFWNVQLPHSLLLRPTEWEHSESKKQKVSFDLHRKQWILLAYLSQLGPA